MEKVQLKNSPSSFDLRARSRPYYLDHPFPPASISNRSQPDAQAIARVHTHASASHRIRTASSINTWTWTWKAIAAPTKAHALDHRRPEQRLSHTAATMRNPFTAARREVGTRCAQRGERDLRAPTGVQSPGWGSARGSEHGRRCQRRREPPRATFRGSPSPPPCCDPPRPPAAACEGLW